MFSRFRVPSAILHFDLLSYQHKYCKKIYGIIPLHVAFSRLSSLAVLSKYLSGIWIILRKMNRLLVECIPKVSQAAPTRLNVSSSS